MKIRIVSALLLLSLSIPALAQEAADQGFSFFDVWHVNAATGNDANNGSSANTPFKTITKALSVANGFDFVHVHPGTYSAASGETFPLEPAGNVRMYGTQGARMTVIDGEKKNVLLMDLDGVGDDTVINGFTFRHAWRRGTTPDPTYGAAISCRNGCAAIIESNLFLENNLGGGKGTPAHPIGGNAGGAAIYADGTSSATIRNNVFQGNQSWAGEGGASLQAKGGLSRGGAVLLAGPSTFVHNTMRLNYSSGGKGSTSPNEQLPGGNGGDGWAGAVYAYNGAVVANNLIMSSQALKGSPGQGTPDGVHGQAKEGGLYCSNCTVTHNNIYSSSPAETVVHPNSLNTYPHHLEWTTYHLPIHSAMRAAGLPAYATPRDFDGFVRPSVPAIGAHEPTTRGDLDGDGKADLFWRHGGTGDNAAWIMDGVTLVSSAFVQAIGPEFQAVGIGDFNGDRKTDVLFRNPATGANSVMFMNGAATQSVGTATPLVSQLWNVAAVADFNADGLSDILWRHATTGANALWMMNGVNLATSHVLDAMSTSWIVAGTGDFNSDHFPDIVWRNPGTGQNRIWYMAGNKLGSIDDSVPSIDGNWTVMSIGEFGGLGAADYFWRNQGTGQNSYWNWNAIEPLPPYEILSLPDPWNVAATGNFDADWYDDILWRNGATGELAVWLSALKNTPKQSAYLPVQLADPNWKVAR